MGKNPIEKSETNRRTNYYKYKIFMKILLYNLLFIINY